MAGVETIEALIVVRTYPTPAKKNVEVSCTAGITRDGKWVRLFPIPYRFLDDDKRFHKYQWIKANVRKAADHRAESYVVDVDSLEIVSDAIGTDDAWRARKDLVLPHRAHCLCCLKKERDARKEPTLGIVRPGAVQGLVLEPVEAEWSADELASLRREQEQGGFFKTPPVSELEKVPFNFKYAFTCAESACKGHHLNCTDGELGASWRSWRARYGDEWEAKFRQRYERDMIERLDTLFFVGTLKAHPAQWNIVGLFYPPKTTGNLFGPN